jgi:hypothetical protein
VDGRQVIGISLLHIDAVLLPEDGIFRSALNRGVRSHLKPLMRHEPGTRKTDVQKTVRDGVFCVDIVRLAVLSTVCIGAVLLVRWMADVLASVWQ